MTKYEIVQKVDGSRKERNVNSESKLLSGNPVSNGKNSTDLFSNDVEELQKTKPTLSTSDLANLENIIHSLNGLSTYMEKKTINNLKKDPKEESNHTFVNTLNTLNTQVIQDSESLLALLNLKEEGFKKIITKDKRKKKIMKKYIDKEERNKAKPLCTGEKGVGYSRICILVTMKTEFNDKSKGCAIRSINISASKAVADTIRMAVI